MSDPIGSVSGLASGIQWRDLVDQMIKAEQARTLDPITARQTAAQAKSDAWASYQTTTSKLGDAAKALRDGTAFDAMTAAAGASPATGRTLFGVTAGAGAVPGNYKVEVLDLAKAEKVSGAVVANASSPLGVAGEFLVNGRRVAVAATDSLGAVRDKINAANAGATPSRVTATVLTSAAGASRLVLTSDSAGAAGIELTDGPEGALGKLGVVDDTSEPNATADGGVQSNRFSSVTTSIAMSLGVTMPAPSTVTIGGRTISVDLNTDSLSSIAARIAAAGGTASTAAETSGTATQYRLTATGTATATTPDGQRALELLGLVKPGRAGVAQTVSGDAPLTSGGAAATGATLLGALDGGPKAGDTFTVRGTRGDGTAATLSFAVGAGSTVQDLLDGMTTAFGGTRAAAASLDASGRLTLTDGTVGDSQLAFSLTSDNAGGGTFSVGRTAATTAGRLREVTAGSDAHLRVDGVLLTRPSNTVSDALTGVTLQLQKAEAGSEVDVSIARDTTSTVAALQAFADAYNSAQSSALALGSVAGPLAYDGTLRAASSSLTRSMLTDVAGLSSSTFTRGAIAGLSLDRTGKLTLDSAAFTAALASNPADVSALFRAGGSTTDGELSYVAAGNDTLGGQYAVSISAPATQATSAGSGFSGVYSDDGSADTMTVTDAVSGKSSAVSLANGDTTAGIVTKLNAAFNAKSMSLTAYVDDAGQVALRHGSFGSSAKFTVSYAGGGADGSAQLGLAAGTYAGTNVQGTIGGRAATGVGQLLTGVTGGPTSGLTVRYTGTTARAAGNVGYALGIGGMMAKAVDNIVRAGDGTAATQTESITASLASLATRATDAQARLDAHRAALITQFTNMETALSRIQAQGTALTQQFAALSASSSNN